MKKCKAKKYKMKNLGYRRTATAAQLIVEFDEDGSVWSVPVQLIADNRDENYKDDKEDTIGFILAGSLSDYEITDWASNNMNWSEMAPYAKRLPDKEAEPDHEAWWPNAEKEVEWPKEQHP